MATYGNGKLDWRGCEDSTPASSAKDNSKGSDSSKSKSGMDWRGDRDSTPSSSPSSNKRGGN